MTNRHRERNTRAGDLKNTCTFATLTARPLRQGWLFRATAGFVAVAMAGCTAPVTRQDSPDQAVTTYIDGRVGEGADNSKTASAVEDAQQPQQDATEKPGFIKLGTGEFIKAPTKPWSRDQRGEITLNFDNAELGEVVKIVMRDILKQNYIIDPKVQGKATIHTTRPLAEASVWKVLETVLELNGAALIRDSGTPRIVPMASAVHVAPAATTAGNAKRRGRGYGIEIVPMQFVSASEMAKNLEGLLGPGTSVRVDEERNLLLLAGPRQSLDRLLDTITIFDVDWLQGMSFALFPLDYVPPSQLVGDLQKILGDQSAGMLAGVVRLEALERLNALLVVSRQPHYITEIQALVTELDQGTNSPGRRLHVYQVENGSAEYIAGVLEQLFAKPDGPPDRETTSRPPQVKSLAPAALPTPLGQASSEQALKVKAEPVIPVPTPTEATDVAESVDMAGETEEPLNIIADNKNNSLLIMASADDYRAVEAAIRQLDVRPRQVLIEATIAEVTLTDNLQYGVQWFLKGASGDNDLLGSLSSTASSTLANTVAPGASFSVTDDVGDVRFLLDLLSNESELKILSSPQLMVIDSETANIRVGNQIPIVTRQTTSISDPDAPIVNEVQYRDTGVLLQVTPRINSGGLVSMKISQEVSEPSADEFAAGNVAVLQRTIDSSVAVRSQQAILLGGLIRENNTKTLTGIPGLMNLPIIGALFSRTVDSVTRTELIVTITPTVIEDQSDADRATFELRQRLDSVERWLDELSQADLR